MTEEEFKQLHPEKWRKRKWLDWRVHQPVPAQLCDDFEKWDAMQKEIRRSHIDNAVLAAYEMFTTSADVAQHLWRRLRLIAVEDVGMGLPLGPVLIDVLHRNFNATPGGEWMMACHAVRLLASAPKDRTSSEHADWVAAKVALGRSQQALAVDTNPHNLPR